MNSITIGNEKGGVGKSTIACNIAVEATLSGLKVLLIDADTQGSSMDFRAIRAEDEKLPQFQAVSITKNTIHKDIKSFQDFDLVIIDAGGRDTATFRSAIMAADLMLIPVLPSQYDIWATQGTIEALEQARSFKDIDARIIVNQVIPNTRVAKEAIEALNTFNVPVLINYLHARVAFKQSIAEGRGISEYERGKGAHEMKLLYEEVSNLL